MKINDDIAYLVLSMVAEIPQGSVRTYGDLARDAGLMNQARLVGRILRLSYLYGDFPCHRVVNASGRLVPGWDEQASLLLQEGVKLLPSGKVDMKRHHSK